MEDKFKGKRNTNGFDKRPEDAKKVDVHLPLEMSLKG